MSINDGKDNKQLTVKEITSLEFAIQKVGKDLVVSDDADESVAKLLLFRKMIDELYKIVKENGLKALEQFNANKLVAKHWTLYTSNPKLSTSPYIVDEDALDYTIEVTKRVNNDEAIEAYLEKNGHLPQGVHQREVKPTVTIRSKAVK